MHTEEALAAMDVSEATKIVMSRIRNLDLENASRVMGYILLQDRGEKEIIMLARGPDALLLSYINQAKAYLALNSSNPPFPDAHIFPQTSPRILVPRDVFHYSNPSSPASFPRSSPVHIPFAADGAQIYGGDELFSGGVEDAVPHPHRRSQSVNDAILLPHLEEGCGFEKRPCSYFARGFCKNGSACNFLHVDNVGDEAIKVGSTSSEAPLQEQRSRTRRSSTNSKSINFLNENQRRGPRNERAQEGPDAAITSRSRQIYLTFPHESSFREEDVSNYFSKFGLVQDVRIPHQEKRMFGFVTFAHPETVKRILAKGNPHHICDSRVLVKPYKDKGKFTEKIMLQKQPQILENVGVFDPPIGVGPRMLLTQEMILTRNMEQNAGLQHAIDLQSQRMMGLQLMDMRYQQFRASFPVAVSAFSPRGSELLKGENIIASCDAGNRDIFQEFESGQETSKFELEDDESILEHILPDNLFSSPENHSIFSNDHTEADDRTNPFGVVSPR
ncbi:hypothetical protein ACS0TY_026828 [Phlomoides rotata]